MKILNPSTILNLRVKNLRFLQSYVDYVIEQSKNKHIKNIRVILANQLKSEDLSIKATNIKEAEALKQFANDYFVQQIFLKSQLHVVTYSLVLLDIYFLAAEKEVSPSATVQSLPLLYLPSMYLHFTSSRSWWNI